MKDRLRKKGKDKKIEKSKKGTIELTETKGF